MKDERFARYWDTVYDKLVRDHRGTVLRHGYLEYPLDVKNVQQGTPH